MYLIVHLYGLFHGKIVILVYLRKDCSQERVLYHIDFECGTYSALEFNKNGIDTLPVNTAPSFVYTYLFNRKRRRIRSLMNVHNGLGKSDIRVAFFDHLAIKARHLHGRLRIILPDIFVGLTYNRQGIQRTNRSHGNGQRSLNECYGQRFGRCHELRYGNLCAVIAQVTDGNVFVSVCRRKL